MNLCDAQYKKPQHHNASPYKERHFYLPQKTEGGVFVVSLTPLHIARKLLPAMTIHSNHLKIKHFVFFSESLLYFHKNGCIISDEINTGELVCAG